MLLMSTYTLWLFWKLTKLSFNYQQIYMHYENTPMQHTAIFHGCKSDNFRLKLFDFCHIFAQNIDCGYTLEPPQ